MSVSWYTLHSSAQFPYCVSVVGWLEYFLQVARRAVVDKPPQYNPLFQLKNKRQIGDRAKVVHNILVQGRLLQQRRHGRTFIVVGTIPVDIDKLTMFVMDGRRQVTYSFSSQVGTASSEHGVEGLLLTSRLTSSSAAGMKTHTLSSTASGLSSGT